MEVYEEKVELPRGQHGLGFNIRGGIDAPHLKNDHGIFVTKIRENGTAFEDGRVKEGDKILEVNGHDLRNVSHSEAVQLFVNAGSKISLLVQHNAEAVLKKKLEEAENKIKDQKPKRRNNETEKDSIVSLWRILGLSVIVIGGGYLANKYIKKPESWSAFTSKLTSKLPWLSGES